jgi:hypothetical protein
MYSSTLSLTSALDEAGDQRHAPAALPPGTNRYLFYRRLGGPQGRATPVYRFPQILVNFFHSTRRHILYGNNFHDDCLENLK